MRGEGKRSADGSSSSGGGGGGSSSSSKTLETDTTTTNAPSNHAQEQPQGTQGQIAAARACDLPHNSNSLPLRMPTDSCRSELHDVAATLANSSFCEDAAWHVLASQQYCTTMEQLEALFGGLKANPVSDLSATVDVSPLMFEKQRTFASMESQQLRVQNTCYRTLALLSDNLSQNVARNSCSLCSGNNRLLSYCYYLLFRAASLTMRVSRPSDALHKFSLPIARINSVDASTWVTGEYPKRVAQSLEHAGGTEYFNFHLLKHVLADCRSATMVNIGANDGFYTFASSVRGCKTISFEPQIGCLQNLYFNALLPIFPRPPLLYNSFVSDSDFSVESGTV